MPLICHIYWLTVAGPGVAWECDAALAGRPCAHNTRVWPECDMSVTHNTKVSKLCDMSVTRVWHKTQECDAALAGRPRAHNTRGRWQVSGHIFIKSFYCVIIQFKKNYIIFFNIFILNNLWYILSQARRWPLARGATHMALSLGGWTVVILTGRKWKYKNKYNLYKWICPSNDNNLPTRTHVSLDIAYKNLI